MVIKTINILVFITYGFLSLGVWLLPIIVAVDCASDKRRSGVSRALSLAGMLLFWPWGGLFYGFLAQRKKSLAILCFLTVLISSGLFFYIGSSAAHFLNYSFNAERTAGNMVAPVRWYRNWNLYREEGVKETGFGVIEVQKSKGLTYVNYRPNTKDAPVTHIYQDREIARASVRRMLPPFMLSFQLERNEPVFTYGAPFSQDVLFPFAQMLVTYFDRYFEYTFGFPSSKRQRYYRQLVIEKDVFRIGRLSFQLVKSVTRKEEMEEKKVSVHQLSPRTVREKLEQEGMMEPMGVHHRLYTINDLLMEAVYESDERKIRELLSKGADINAKSIFGETPLMEAAQLGYMDIVRLLIDSGAEPSITRADGKTAADLARANYRKDIADYLDGPGEMPPV